jgi:hypothetical protein
MSQADRVDERVEEPALAPEEVVWLDSVLDEYHDVLQYLREH